MHSIRQRMELQPPRFCFASFFFLSGARIKPENNSHHKGELHNNKLMLRNRNISDGEALAGES